MRGARRLRVSGSRMGDSHDEYGNRSLTMRIEDTVCGFTPRIVVICQIETNQQSFPCSCFTSDDFIAVFWVGYGGWGGCETTIAVWPQLSPSTL
jgi:hypothetical protein